MRAITVQIIAAVLLTAATLVTGNAEATYPSPHSARLSQDTLTR
ncbi:MAG: hypothetical protein AB7S80_12015 [Rhizobiaceae bacterium]